MVHFSDSDMLESLSIIGYLIVENEQLMQGWWVFSQPEENTLTGSAMLRPLHTEEFTVTATAATEGAFNYPPFLSAMILFRSLGQRLVVMFNCVSCLLPQTPKLLWLQTAIPDTKFSNLLLRTILSLFIVGLIHIAHKTSSRYSQCVWGTLWAASKWHVK